ncbi:hypothetical protein [Aminipila sp.]|uniref:hypothetical protein n=1 Tax=Aminipila sp. TaxID=2060095 RepID=UPI00289CE680|nr:hypothetical protein [Aminipila sp.]
MISDEQTKNIKEYDIKNNIITIERYYIEEKKVKDVLKEYLQSKPLKAGTS